MVQPPKDAGFLQFEGLKNNQKFMLKTCKNNNACNFSQRFKKNFFSVGGGVPPPLRIAYAINRCNKVLVQLSIMIWERPDIL